MASASWYSTPLASEKQPGPAKELVSAADTLEKANAWRDVNYKLFATLYRDRSVLGFSPGKWKFSSFSLSSDFQASTAFGKPLVYNVVKSCIDTAVAKLCLSRPMPKFLTSAAREDLAQQAKQLERYVYGVMMYNNAWEKAAQAFRDGAIYGTGYLYVRSEGGRILIERVHPAGVLVDDNAAMNGDARTLYHRDWWDREALKALFPDAAEAIEKANRDLSGSDGMLLRDLLRVVQGWHLPRGEGKGRHTIAVDSDEGTLVDTEWNCPRFPMLPVRWSWDLAGWHGVGLAEELQAIQIEINQTLAKISGNMEHLAVPYIAKPRGSAVNDEHLLTNEPYRLIEYDGPVPPSIVCPPAVSDQVFSYLEQLYKRAFEIAGISMLSATSQKPAGLYSGIALTSYLDVETQRFSQQQRAWEQLFVDLAWRIVDCAKNTDDLKGVTVASEKNDAMDVIDLDGVDLDESFVEISVYPSSSLPKTLSGRIQHAVDLVQAGIFNRTQAAAVIGELSPDIDKQTRLNNAPFEDLSSVMEHMLATGEYVAPLPFQDCALGIKLATRYWSRARINGVDESRYGLLEAWMDEAAKLLDAGRGRPPEPPAPPPPQGQTAMATPAIPGGPGMPVPQTPTVGQ